MLASAMRNSASSLRDLGSFDSLKQIGYNLNVEDNPQLVDGTGLAYYAAHRITNIETSIYINDILVDLDSLIQPPSPPTLPVPPHAPSPTPLAPSPALPPVPPARPLRDTDWSLARVETPFGTDLGFNDAVGIATHDGVTLYVADRQN